MISPGEKMFSPKFEPTLTSKQPSAVVRPVYSGDTAIRVFQDPYWPMVIRVRLGPGPPYPLSFSSISTQTRTSDDVSGVVERGLRYCAVSTGATVTCAASRSRFSTNRLSMTKSTYVKFAVLCPIASVKFTVPCPISLIKLLARWLNQSLTGGIEIASFNAFSSDHRLWVNCSGVRGTERLAH